MVYLRTLRSIVVLLIQFLDVHADCNGWAGLDVTGSIDEAPLLWNLFSHPIFSEPPM